ncbi:MAG: hypothetical protein ABJA78_07550 [Ferruginibacter sp.]
MTIKDAQQQVDQWIRTNQTGVDLTDALQKNFEKKPNRDAQRHQDNQKIK